MDSLFATHPSTADRIAALRELDRAFPAASSGPRAPPRLARPPRRTCMSARGAISAAARRGPGVEGSAAARRQMKRRGTPGARPGRGANKRRGAPEARPEIAVTDAGVATRSAAGRLLDGVLHGRPLDALVDPATGDPVFRRLQPRDRALARAIVATTLRRRGQILGALRGLMERGRAAARRGVSPRSWKRRRRRSSFSTCPITPPSRPPWRTPRPTATPAISSRSSTPSSAASRASAKRFLPLTMPSGPTRRTGCGSAGPRPTEKRRPAGSPLPTSSIRASTSR